MYTANKHHLKYYINLNFLDYDKPIVVNTYTLAGNCIASSVEALIFNSTLLFLIKKSFGSVVYNDTIVMSSSQAFTQITMSSF